MKPKIILMQMILLLILIQSVSALSDNAIQSKQNITEAGLCLDQMIKENISIQRANSSLQEAIQLYNAQLALELQAKVAKYEIVDQYAQDVCSIKNTALEAQDELKIFKERFKDAEKGTNLSEIYETYDNIILSFEEERFEDTIKLIDSGYIKLSEFQAKQTAINLFYETTSKTLKNFVINNWGKLLSGGAIVVFLLLIFWAALKRMFINLKIEHLEAQKKSINSLIKNLQKQYFEQGKISQSEYLIKLRRFKEMILDIDRQIPLLKEELVLLKKRKVFKNKKLQSIESRQKLDKSANQKWQKKEKPGKRKQKRKKKKKHRTGIL